MSKSKDRMTHNRTHTMSAANVADWDFNFQFEHIKAIEHGKIIDQKYLLWPVEKFGETNKKIMYLQIENKQRGRITPSGGKEKRLLDLVC